MLEDFHWWDGGKKWAGWCLSVRMYVCKSVRLSKHFRLWIPNSWSDRDGRILIQCARTAERRWYRFRTDQLHVTCATCDRANPCKKVVAQGAIQTNGRIRLKLFMSIVKLGGQLPLDNQRWRPLGTCHRHVRSDFINSFIAPERRGRLGREGHRSTGTDGGKIASSIVEESWVRIPTKSER